MTILNARASVVGTTTNTTWNTTANAVDGAFGVNNLTYCNWTNTTANAVGTIELSFGSQFASIPAGSVINSIDVTLRHYESQTTRLANVQFQPWDGATAIGTIFTATRATSARSDTATFNPTLAQLKSATFKVRVTATRFNGTQAGIFYMDYVDVVVDYTAPQPPTSSFTASAPDVVVGGSVTFTDTSTDNGEAITAWAWDFGAGATPATANTQGPHAVTYSTVGTKTVTLTTTNLAGSDPGTGTVDVHPVVDAVISEVSTGPYQAGASTIEVRYSNTVLGSDADVTGTASIDWGDGTADFSDSYSSGAWAGAGTATHLYTVDAAYTITLTVNRTAPAGVTGSDVATLGITIDPSAIVPVVIWNGTSFKADAKIWNGVSWRSDAKLWDGVEWRPFTTLVGPPEVIPATGLLGWWAADDLAQADLSSVTSWPAHGGAGPTFAAATDPPVFRTNILNGKPAVRFSATTSDVLLVGAGAWMRNVDGGMIFVVGNTTSAAVRTFVAINKNVLGSARFSLYMYTAGLDIGSRRLDADAYADSLSATFAATPKIIRATRNWAAATASIHVNGVATAVNNTAVGTAGFTSDTDSAGMQLGRDYSGQPLDGDMFEVIIYERVLSASEITQVEDYLSTKYAI